MFGLFKPHTHKVSYFKILKGTETKEYIKKFKSLESAIRFTDDLKRDKSIYCYTIITL
jgi:hypothetical protein